MHAQELTVDMPYGGEVLSSSTAVGGCIQLPVTWTVKANLQSTNTAGYASWHGDTSILSSHKEVP